MNLDKIKEAERRWAARGWDAILQSGAIADADHALLLAAVPDLLAEIARLKELVPAPPRYTCGDNCPTCLRCMGCGYCRCSGTLPHSDDKPDTYALPSDALTGVP